MEEEAPARISPVVLDGPIPPYHAIYYYSSLLSPFELTEILKYPKIYYLGFLGRKISINMNDKRSYGFDTPEGHYRVVFGDHLAYRFEVKSLLGAGEHSKVVLCHDHDQHTDIAVKILSTTKDSERRNKIEQMILSKAKKSKSEVIVSANHCFMFRNHLCVTFELLSKDLEHMMRLNGTNTLAKRLVRAVAQDLVQAMCEYSKWGVVHGCITPSNVLLVPDTNASFKLGDFSHAFIGEVRPYEWKLDLPYEYRCPEVVLDLPYGIGLDMWCLGCLLVQLTVGKRLFVAKDDINQIATFIELMGNPTPEYLESIPKYENVWNPDTKQLYPDDLDQKRPEKSLNLKQMLGNDSQMADFLSRIFVWEPEQRLTPEEALNHPWITNRDARLPELVKK